jgi:hypothetical protein
MDNWILWMLAIAVLLLAVVLVVLALLLLRGGQRRAAVKWLEEEPPATVLGKWLEEEPPATVLGGERAAMEAALEPEPHEPAAVSPAAPPQPEPEPRERYANAVLMDKTKETLLDQGAPIALGKVFSLRLDIGELSLESAVTQPVPIPERLLPKDIWLDVMVSSTHFAVGRSLSDLDRSQVAHGCFFLPGDGGAAATPEGDKYLYFFMRAPDKAQKALARIGYYYRNSLVQSQRLVADVGGEVGGYRIEVDYTLSQSLTGLDNLPSRHQVSIVTNDNGDGKHQIIVRSGDSGGSLLHDPLTYEINEEIVGKLVMDLRKALWEVKPREKKRSKDLLIEDLRRLAPLGEKLWDKVIPAEHIRTLYPLLHKRGDLVIQVSRPTTSSFAFPWGLVYDITIEDGVRPEDLKPCTFIEKWDGSSPLVKDGLRRCPEVPNGVHPRNTLCPFGFWGYRYPIEQLTSTKDAVLEIRVPPKFEFVAAKHRSLDTEGAHIRELREKLQNKFPQAVVSLGVKLEEIRNLLGKEDLPLVYFYCHGKGSYDFAPDTYLAVGDDEKITGSNFKDWVKDWAIANTIVWNRVRPLVFINACHSLEIHPDTLVSFLEAFVGAGHAAGVIGTEVTVSDMLAKDVAKQFFERFFKEQTVAQALHAIRLDYLATGNLFGLVYTPYCWADLKLVPQ